MSFNSSRSFFHHMFIRKTFFCNSTYDNLTLFRSASQLFILRDERWKFSLSVFTAFVYQFIITLLNLFVLKISYCYCVVNHLFLIVQDQGGISAHLNTHVFGYNRWLGQLTFVLQQTVYFEYLTRSSVSPKVEVVG